MYHRKTAVAGSFYTDDPESLKSQIAGFMDVAEKGSEKVESDLYGIISPHAGYVYSGQVAAYAYNQLKGCKSDTFIVLAPSHRGRFDGASVIPEGIYETPLGDVDIDSDLGKALLGSDGFEYYREVHEVEHSLEVQVPFLKYNIPDISIVPVIVGAAEDKTVDLIGKSIADAVKKSGKDIKIVISTDLSHYHSYDRAQKMDSRFIEAVESFNDEIIRKVISSGESEACGIAPLLAGLRACRELGAGGIKIINYANSGDVSGERGQVVGYMAGVIYGK